MSKVHDAVGHAERSAETNKENHLRQKLKEDIDAAGRMLSQDREDAFLEVLRGLRSRILPTLREYSDRDLGHYDDVIKDDRPWDWHAIRAVESDAEPLARRLQRGDRQAKDTVRRALQSASSAAAAEEVVLDEYASRVDAHGFAGKVGESLQDREMDLGNPVRIVSERSGALKTLFTGGTGNGKSVALETEAEDYYLRNFQDGRDFKLIDPAGLRDGENWLYDIAQQEPDLQDVRDDQELPTTFHEAERGPNKIEIYAPLTPGLRDQDLPFDIDDESFTVQPFTIPAADIRKPLLVSILTAKLTPEQESVIRDAYDEVDRRKDDWALTDLAQEIRSRDELKASKQKPPIRTLRQLQNRGFIRTRDCEYTLDWKDLFTSTERYTSFTQSFLDTAISQLIVFGYLANSIVKKRESMYGIPEAVVVMRELWKIAPHNRRQEFDERAAQLQEAIGHMFSKLFRDNRHAGVHVLADTQQPSDLLKPVREMFNRYVIFETDRDTVKDIFEWTANDNWKSFYNTLTPKPGEASVTGMVEPAINERHIQFVGPVKYAAASHHHKRDRGIDSNGWRARTKYLTPTEECGECGSKSVTREGNPHIVVCDGCEAEMVDYSAGRNEELRTPGESFADWPFEVPTRLIIDSTKEEESLDPTMEPVAAFVEDCIRYDTSESVQRTDVRAAFNAWVVDHPDIDRDEPWDFDDQGTTQRFGSRLKDAVDNEIQRTRKDYDPAYGNLTLTRRGKEYLKQSTGGFDDAASPIRE